jgi:hypothetical protein
MSNEILKYGVVYYLQKIDKKISKQQYEPVSYEQWKMLRELEPTKFRNDYDWYVQSKKEQFDQEVEIRKNCGLELMTKHYSLHPKDIDKTKQSIRDIQSNERFEKWCTDEHIIETIINH